MLSATEVFLQKISSRQSRILRTQQPKTPALHLLLPSITEAEMRSEARKSDARDAIALMQGSIRDGEQFGLGMGGDTPVFADFRVGSQSSCSTGTGRMSKAKLRTAFLGALQREATRRNSGMFTFSEIAQVVRSCGFSGMIPRVDEFIEALNYEGDLQKKGPSLYKLPTFSSNL